MRVAVFSDIHANFPACQRVIGDAKSRKTGLMIQLGDVLGFAPYPEEVIALLQKEKIKSIIGNYDLKVLQFRKKISKWLKKKDAVKVFSFWWSHDNISSKARKYLKRLPKTMKLSLGKKKVFCVHGSPDDMEEPLGPDTPLKRLEKIVETNKVDLILCGHSHEFFAKKVRGVWLVNPGSVGRSFDGSVKSSYAIVDISRKKISVEHFRIPYPVEQVIKRMQQEKFPQELCVALSQGRSIDDMEIDEGDE